jgi:hypothetical protein
LVPDGKPLTSTYLPSLSDGLKTYPGLPGTNFPVGNDVDGAEAREAPDDSATSLRLVPPVPLDLWLCPPPAPTGTWLGDVDPLSGGTDWPGLVTSDGRLSVDAVVYESSPRFRVA